MSGRTNNIVLRDLSEAPEAPEAPPTLTVPSANSKYMVLSVSSNLTDFLPSGSFALYKTMESILGLPLDATTCSTSQTSYMIAILVVTSLFSFFSTLYPTVPITGVAVTDTFRDRITNHSLIIRAVLTVIAFLGLTLAMQDVMGCIFGEIDITTTRILPTLLAVICSIVEQIRLTV